MHNDGKLFSSEHLSVWQDILVRRETQGPEDLQDRLVYQALMD